MYSNEAKEILEAQKGNHEIITKLVEANSGLIWSIVKRFSGRGFELEDLYQIGTIGLIKSIKRFDTDFEVKLSTYAVPYILGEIKRFIRDDGPIKISRSIKELNVKIMDIKKEYINRTGKEIGVNQIAEILKVPKEDIAVALDSNQPIESIYQDTNSEKSGQTTILDKLTNDTDEAEELVNRLSIKELISNLNPQEKQIILLRYYKEKTQTEVAKILGISQVQVSRIEKRTLNFMKSKLIQKEC